MQRPTSCLIAFMASMLAAGSVFGQASPHGQSFGDWRMTCRAGGVSDCALVQRVPRGAAERLAVRLVRLEQGQLNLVLTLPLRTALKAGIELQIDRQAPSRARFDFCDENGCHAAIPLEQKLLRALRRGLSATITTHNLTGKVAISTVSLKGVTAGTDRLP